MEENDWVQLSDDEGYTIKILDVNINDDEIIADSLTVGDLFRKIDNSSKRKKAYYTITPGAEGYDICNA